MSEITIYMPELPSQKFQAKVLRVKKGVIYLQNESGLKTQFSLETGQQLFKGKISNWDFWRVDSFDLMKLQRENKQDE